MSPLHERRLAICTLVATVLLAGCAVNKRATGEFGTQETWRGRLSVRVDSAPVQAFSAAFELQGSADSGTLTLTSPLGTMLAEARWTPASVVWRSAGEQRSFKTLDEMTQQLTGTALPVAALFDWLRGIATPSSGWQPDLQEYALGRIQARRVLPAPAAQLRIVLEQ